MITFLNGKLISKSSNEAIIDCNGIGYLVQISLNTFETLPDINNNIFIHTLFIPKEDSWNLYGFHSIAERQIFQLLTSVSGIGPKSAILILSAVNKEDLVNMLVNNNITSLTKIPGIGKKTAERLILELKDKIIKVLPNIEVSSSDLINYQVKDEALSALVTLGYNKVLAEKFVKQAFETIGKDATVEQIIKVSLKNSIK